VGVSSACLIILAVVFGVLLLLDFPTVVRHFKNQFLANIRQRICR
jgi:hypothetical protein